jgi:hypothetical protein
LSTVSVSHEKPERVASTQIETAHEPIVEGVSDSKRKSSKANITCEQSEIFSTQTVQAAGEALVETQPMKPETVRAKVTPKKSEVSQTSQAHLVSDGIRFDSPAETVAQKSTTTIALSELEEPPRATVHQTAEFLKPEPVSAQLQEEKAKTVIENRSQESVKSSQILQEESILNIDSPEIVKKAEIKQDKLKTTKTTIVESEANLEQFNSDYVEEPTRKAVIVRDNLPDQVPSTTMQDINESVKPNYEASVDTECATVNQESSVDVGLIGISSTAEETVKPVPKPKPRKEKAKKMLGEEKLEASEASSISLVSMEETLLESKPETEVANMGKVDASTTSSTIVQVEEQVGLIKLSPESKKKASAVRDNVVEPQIHTVQTVAEKAQDNEVEEESTTKDKATVTKQAMDTTQETVQVVTEKVTPQPKPRLKKDKVSVKQEELSQIQVTSEDQVILN